MSNSVQEACVAELSAGQKCRKGVRVQPSCQGSGSLSQHSFQDWIAFLDALNIHVIWRSDWCARALDSSKFIRSTSLPDLVPHSSTRVHH